MSSTETETDGGPGPEWFAVHVHLPYSLQSSFLREAVAPLVEDLGVRGHFFFLRYWKGGPHLRLRFDGRRTPAAPEEIIERLAGSIPEATEDLRAQYAVQADSQAELARLEGEEVMEAQPLGTVRRFDYSPEYGKYGGEQGIAVAESVFCATSGAVLDLLEATRASNSPPIGEAVRVMAVSLRGVGLGAEESIPFLRDYERRWSAFVQNGSEAGWDAVYAKASEGLVDMCGRIWRSTETDAFSDAYATATERARVLFAERPDTEAFDIELPGTSYMECVAQYLHTTNNRLGLIPAGEALAAHLMHRALLEL